MGWLSTILGTPKIVSTVADTVKSGVGMLDNAFYTDQEKATNGLKMQDLWLKIQQAIANENSIKSVTRRILAWGIVCLFLFLILAACAVWKLDPNWAEYIKGMIIETKLMYLTMIVAFFYFGYWGVSNIIKAKKEE